MYYQDFLLHTLSICLERKRRLVWLWQLQLAQDVPPVLYPSLLFCTWPNIAYCLFCHLLAAHCLYLYKSLVVTTLVFVVFRHMATAGLRFWPLERRLEICRQIVMWQRLLWCLQQMRETSWSRQANKVPAAAQCGIIVIPSQIYWRAWLLSLQP